ncbi:hypothetical protein G7Z17_g3985 [Cylindrodendrum hubeiense]|uniref:Zn(2)-C6 fungal-type domain-containing protein n=1 Tax=Cylindrodendrum hubeiense TaxID=595255 RepID=A0A9P5H9Q9_9HYPO|nr:hypothetical protein G7Z17_g3985 [Cylindrodendrum hubeiense]
MGNLLSTPAPPPDSAQFRLPPSTLLCILLRRRSPLSRRPDPSSPQITTTWPIHRQQASVPALPWPHPVSGGCSSSRMNTTPTTRARNSPEAARPERAHSSKKRKLAKSADFTRRKRAVVACQFCRLRKTKCDNVRPCCGYCERQKAKCVYGDAEWLEETAQDADQDEGMGRRILKQLEEIKEMLEKNQSPSEPSPSANPSVNTPAVFITATPQTTLQNDTTPRTIVQSPWTDVPDNGSQPTSTKAPASNPASRPHALARCESLLRWPVFNGTVPEEVTRIESFLMDSDYKVRQQDADEPSGHLVACALAAYTVPWKAPVDIANDPEATKQHMQHQADTRLEADAYYLAAKKRFGLLGHSIQDIQCLFLASIEILLEAGLPTSGLEHLSYPDAFPAPPPDLSSSQLGVASPESIGTPQDQQRLVDEKGWCYYLAEISLRRAIEETIQVLYQRGDYFWLQNQEYLVRHYHEFEQQISLWQVRSDSFLRPLIYYVLHSPPDHVHSDTIHHAQKGIKLCADLFTRYSSNFRHGGSWFFARKSFLCACLVLAVVLEPNRGLQPPPNWDALVIISLETLKRWGRDAPDIWKMYITLDTMYRAVSE